jgi:hypothetical protein
MENHLGEGAFWLFASCWFGQVIWWYFQPRSEFVREIIYGFCGYTASLGVLAYALKYLIQWKGLPS